MHRIQFMFDTKYTCGKIMCAANCCSHCQFCYSAKVYYSREVFRGTGWNQGPISRW